MPLVGNLRDFALHDFLYLVDRGYKTGCLRLTQPTHAAALFFDQGKLVAVTRSDRREQLGPLLVRLGKLTAAQLEQVTAAQHNGIVRPLAPIVIEQGHMGAAALQACVQGQLEGMVYDLFGWREGEFRFEAGAKPALDDLQALMPIPVENLIMEGVRRVDETTRIKERIPHNDMLVLASDQKGQAAPSVNLTANEWRVLARVNGKTTINDIAHTTGLSTFDVSHIVFGFITTGLAEVRKPAPVVPRTTPSTMWSSTATATSPAKGSGSGIGSLKPGTGSLKRGLVGRLIERIRGM